MTRFDSIHSFGDYDDRLRTLIHLFKYEHMPSLGDPLGRLLARALPLNQSFDALVPLPLHWRRQLERGFNQSRLLAIPLARRAALPVVNALRRVRYTTAQAGLAGAARRSNVAGAFAAVPKAAAALRGARVLLIDDVLTSGATANSAAGALKAAGVAHVTVLTLARTDRRKVFDAPRNVDLELVSNSPRRSGKNL